jgi:hypothetical protein
MIHPVLNLLAAHMKYVRLVVFSSVFLMTTRAIPTNSGVNYGLRKECLGTMEEMRHLQIGTLRSNFDTLKKQRKIVKDNARVCNLSIALAALIKCRASCALPLFHNPHYQSVLHLEAYPFTLLQLSYRYETMTGAQSNHDNNGNVLSQTITVPATGTVAGFTATQTYGYDGFNRLTSMMGTVEHAMIYRTHIRDVVTSKNTATLFLPGSLRRAPCKSLCSECSSAPASPAQSEALLLHRVSE